MSDQNWRTDIDAGDYFGHQKKKLQIADRRPVIRKPSDLVGPGIGANATRITNFGDLLATYNGFFSSAAGAIQAPNSTDAFVGFVSSDALLGGTQTFSSLTDSNVWTRTFTRNLLDPATIYWGNWEGGLVTRTEFLEGAITALTTRVSTLEGQVTSLNSSVASLNAAARPLYTGTMSFFMTSAPHGFDAYGTASFGHTFPSAPCVWAIRTSIPSGSARTVVSGVDLVTTTTCRIGVLNTGPADATFTGMEVRWFARQSG